MSGQKEIQQQQKINPGEKKIAEYVDNRHIREPAVSDLQMIVSLF